MQMIQFSGRKKQALLTIILLAAITLTFFATKAWAMDNGKPVSHAEAIEQASTYKRRFTPEDFISSTTTSTTTTTTAPKKVAPKAIPTTHPLVTPTGDIWNQLAECESSQDWSYNGSSGFDGGLQFSPATWTRMHTHWGMNTGYEFAWQAPREVQIEVAIRLMQVSSGTHSQWPVCSRKIGMPNKF